MSAGVALVAAIGSTVALVFISIATLRWRLRHAGARAKSRAFEVAGRAQALADLAVQLSVTRASAFRHAWFDTEHGRLMHTARELFPAAEHPAFRRAVCDLVDALNLLGQAVAQAIALHSVPDVPPSDLRCSIAEERLQQRSHEVRAAAIFMAAVVELDGC